MYTFVKQVHPFTHPWSLAARSAAMSHMACIECQITLQGYNVVTYEVELQRRDVHDALVLNATYLDSFLTLSFDVAAVNSCSHVLHDYRS
jgi:hypothetical protein